MRKGGKRGPALVPGKADESLLFKLAAHRANPVMPPLEKKNLKPLSPDELGLLKSWIDSGAIDDSAEFEARPAEIELGAIPSGIQPVAAIDITPDGRRIAFGRGNIVQFRDTDTGTEIVSLGGHRDIVQSIRISPDGTPPGGGRIPGGYRLDHARRRRAQVDQAQSRSSENFRNLRR